MKLSLLYCEALNIYRLRNDYNGREKTLTQADIDDGGDLFRDWAAVCRAHPDTSVDCDIPFPKGRSA